MKIRPGENLSRLTNMKKLSQNLIHNVTSIMTVSDINYLLLYLIILLTLSIKQPEKKNRKERTSCILSYYRIASLSMQNGGVPLCFVVLDCRLDSVFCKHGTMQFYWRKT
uniref:Putative uncharacterized protein YOR225W n=1 Tax=Saccharomyces cerevisiae (strain ATCC 204508 / S288c) TaxID=559292 RepID=YO225_YEAST|nr:RecName: Full=Putative uncharacterized protein YOR225W [Saccharomyces cerevisiae S288C]CAA63188.1 unnamed protein product [Saccharomyces cerevisiae]CAA99444.1 unnamed protein product [Saccharomyces cerevisiae]